MFLPLNINKETVRSARPIKDSAVDVTFTVGVSNPVISATVEARKKTKNDSSRKNMADASIIDLSILVCGSLSLAPIIYPRLHWAQRNSLG